MVAFLFFTV